METVDNRQPAWQVDHEQRTYPVQDMYLRVVERKGKRGHRRGRESAG